MRLIRRRRLGLMIREEILLKHRECVEGVRHYRREISFGYKHGRECYMIYRECKHWNGRKPTGMDIAYIRMADRFYKIRAGR